MPKLKSKTAQNAVYNRGHISYLDYQRYLELPETYTLYDVRSMNGKVHQASMLCKLLKAVGMSEIVGISGRVKAGRPMYIYKKIPKRKWEHTVQIRLSYVTVKFSEFMKINQDEITFH